MLSCTVDFLPLSYKQFVSWRFCHLIYMKFMEIKSPRIWTLNSNCLVHETVSVNPSASESDATARPQLNWAIPRPTHSHLRPRPRPMILGWIGNRAATFLINYPLHGKITCPTTKFYALKKNQAYFYFSGSIFEFFSIIFKSAMLTLKVPGMSRPVKSFWHHWQASPHTLLLLLQRQISKSLPGRFVRNKSVQERNGHQLGAPLAWPRLLLKAITDYDGGGKWEVYRIADNGRMSPKCPVTLNIGAWF